MKRSLLLSLTLSALSCAGAQSSYFGLHVDGVGSLNPSSVAPLAGLQVGGSITDNVELRVSGLVLVLANFVQIDVLYTQNLSDTLRGHGGVGGDAGLIAFYDDGTILDVHATAGLEYGLGSGIGLFSEVQPLYILKTPDIGFGSGGLVGKLNASTFTSSAPSLSKEA